MMEGDDIVSAEAIIDNGRFGTRTVRFETGRLAKQAAGSAMAYLDDDTAILSATTVGKTPKDQFDFFPLTVDVEERSYAAGRIPGSFFRREGRPGTEAILAARLIDRPLRPGFKKGLRNEVQVVETVLSAHPNDAYDVLAINAASMSTQIAGLPFSGPIAGTRLALIDDQWVAFPRWSEMERSVFNIVVAGRIVVPPKMSWPTAWKPPSPSSAPCARHSSRWLPPPRRKPLNSPCSSTTPTNSTPPWRTGWAISSPPPC